MSDLQTIVLYAGDFANGFPDPAAIGADYIAIAIAYEDAGVLEFAWFLDGEWRSEYAVGAPTVDLASLQEEGARWYVPPTWHELPHNQGDER